MDGGFASEKITCQNEMKTLPNLSGNFDGNLKLLNFSLMNKKINFPNKDISFRNY